MKINGQFPVVCGIISNHPAAKKSWGRGEDSERKDSGEEEWNRKIC